MSDAISILWARDAKLLWLEAGQPATRQMFGRSCDLPGTAYLEQDHQLGGAVRKAVANDLSNDQIDSEPLRPWIMSGEAMYSPDDILDLYTMYLKTPSSARPLLNI